MSKKRTLNVEDINKASYQDAPISNNMVSIDDAFNQVQKGEVSSPNFSSSDTFVTGGETRRDINAGDYKVFSEHNVRLLESTMPVWEDQRAKNQTGWELIGKGAAQLGSELTLGTLEGISSIPDVLINGVSLITGGKTDFENDITALLRSAQDNIKEGTEVFKASTDSDFDLTNSRWWASNISSIGSAASFIIPTMIAARTSSGIFRGAGALARRTKSLGWIDDFAKATKTEDLARLISTKGESIAGTLGGTMYANAAESFEEAVYLTRDAYSKAINSGKSEEEANNIAAQVGRDVYLGNLVNIALELPSTMMLLKGFSNTRNLLNKKLIGKAPSSVSGELLSELPNPLIKGLKGVGVEVATEGAQEIVNYISSEEAKRNADLAILGDEEESSYMTRVIDDYLTKGDLWTAAFFGGLGGAGFVGGSAIKSRLDNKIGRDDISSKRQERNLRELQPLRLMEIASLRNDPTLFSKGESDLVFEKVYNSAESGTVGAFESELNSISTLKDEELESLNIDKNSIPNLLEKTKIAENAYLESINKIGVKDPSQNSGLDLNRELAKAIFNKNSTLLEVNKVKSKLDSKRSELIQSISLLGEEVSPEVLQVSEIDSSIETLVSERNKIKRRYSNLLNRTKRGTKELNRKTINSLINSIDKDIKNKRNTRNKLISEINEQVKENKTIPLDRLKIKDFSEGVEIIKLQSELSSLISSYDLHLNRINQFKDQESIDKLISASNQDLKEESEILKSKVDGTNDTQQLKELKLKSNSKEDSEYIESKIEEIKDLKESDIPLSTEEQLAREVQIDDDTEFLKQFIRDSEADIAAASNDSISDSDIFSMSESLEESKELEEKKDNKFNLNKTVEIVGEDGTKYNYFDKNEDGTFNLIDVNGNIRNNIKEDLIAEDNPSTSIDSNKEVLPTIDIFNTLMIREKFGDTKLLKETLSKSDWKDNIRFIVDDRFSKKNKQDRDKTVKERLKKEIINEEDGTKDIKPQTLFNNSWDNGKKIFASSSLDLDIKLQVKDQNNKWVDAADIANPDQYVIAETLDEVPSILNFEEVPYSKFIEHFSIRGEVPTEAQYIKFQESHKNLKQFHNEVKELYKSSDKNRLDITDKIIPTIYGFNYESIPVTEEIPLENFSGANLGTDSNPSFEIIDMLERSYISLDTTKEIPERRLNSRYIANVILNNGIETQIPLRPRKLSNFQSKKVIDSINSAINSFNRKVEFNEASITNANNIVTSIGLYIPPVDDNYIELVPTYSKASNTFNLTLDVGKLGGKSKKVFIDKINSIEDIINKVKSETGIILNKNNFKNSIPVGSKKVEPHLFSSLTSQNVFSNFSLKLEFISPTNDSTLPTTIDVPSETVINLSGLNEEETLNKILEVTERLESDPENTDLKNQLSNLESHYHSINKPGDIKFKLGNSRFITNKRSIDKIIKNISPILPSNIEIKSIKDITSNIIDKDITWGFFQDNIIAINESSPKGTEYHEAFHAIFNTSLNKEAQEFYLNIERQDGEVTESDISNLRNSSIYYKNTPSKELESIVLEERIADKFQSYNTRSPFKRLFDYIKSLIDWVTGNKEELSILFRSINKGKFKNSNIVNNSFRSLPKFKLLPKVNSVKSEQVINTVAATVINKIKDSNFYVSDITNDNKLNKIKINNIVDVILKEKADLYNPLNYSKEYRTSALREQLIYKSPESSKIIKEEVYKILNKYSFNLLEESIQESIDNEESERSFDISISEFGGFDNIRKEIKQFIALTTYTTLDEFGNEVETAIDFPQTYALLERSLAGKTPEQQLQVLRVLSEDSKQIAALYSKLKKEVPSLEDLNSQKTVNQKSLLNRFHSTFEKEFINYVQVLRDSKGELKVFSANQSDLKHIQFKNWGNLFTETIEDKLQSSSFKNRTLNLIGRGLDVLNRVESKSNNLITEEEAISRTNEAFNSVGISLSRGYIKFSLGITSKNLKAFDNIYKIESKDLKVLTSIISKNNNPFIEGDESIDSGMIGRILRIAEADSMFRDDLFQSNFKDADNKTRYSYILPSHLLVKTRNISNDLKVDETINKYKEDSYHKYNWILQESNESIKNLFTNSSIAITGDIRQEDQDSGSTFKTLNSKSMILSTHGLYNTNIKETVNIDGNKVETGRLLSYYTPMVLESKSTSISVLLPKDENLYIDGEITKDTLNSITSTVFAQEYKRLKGDYKESFKNNKFVNLKFLDSNEVYDSLGIVRDKDGKILEVPKEIKNIEYIKQKIKQGFNSEINSYINLLVDNEIIKVSSSGELENILLPKSILKDTNIRDYIGNFLLNDYLNSTAFNQLIQGDLAKAKDSVDRTKRNGGEIASGPSRGSGTYKVAYYEGETQYVNSDTLLPTNEKDEKAVEIDADDAQVYVSVDWKVNTLANQGTLTDKDLDIIERIKEGKSISPRELSNSSIDFISEKGVHYDGTYYHKMSEFVLTKELTSYTPDRGKTWLPLRGKEKLHNMRVFLENNKIDKLIPLSASKLKSDKVIKNSKFIDGSINEEFKGTEYDTYQASELENRWWRQQLENKSGKQNIVLGTQLLQLIDTELPNTDKNREIRESLYNNISRSRQYSMDRALSLISGIKGDSRNISSFISKLKSTVEESGGDSNLLEFLEEDNGDFKYDLNLPHIEQKAQQLYLAHFNKGVLSQKVKGNKSTLVSAAGYEVLRDSNSGEIIDKETYLKSLKIFNSSDYSSSKLKIHRNEEGNISFAEVAMTRRQAKFLNIKLDDISNKEVHDDLLTMLGVRIPTQTHHSMIPFKVVEFLPEYYGDVIIAPPEIVYLSGSDYDVDSLYSQRKDFYIDSNNTIKIYKEPESDIEGWEQFLTYELDNNKDLKKLIRDKQSNSSEYEDLLRQEQEDFIDFENLSKLLLTGEDSISLRKKELNQLFIDESLRELELPTNIEEYSNFNNKDVKGVTDNNILNDMLSIITNPELSESLFTPATISGLEEDANLIFNTLRGQEEGAYLHNSLNGKFDSWNNNTVGKRNVGNAANANLINAFLSKMNVKLKNEYSFKFDNKDYKDYSIVREDDITINNLKVKVNKEIRRKADTLSTIVSAMTDNAKERLAAKLNLTTSNLSEFSNLISLGIGRTRVMLLANQPVIREITKIIDSTTSSLFPVAESKLSIIDTKIKDLISEINRLNPNYSSTSKDRELNIESQELLNDILHESVLGISNIEDSKYYENQLKVLRLYRNLIESTKYFSMVGQLLKINKGIGTDFVEVSRIKDSIEKLGLLDKDSLTKDQLDSIIFENLNEAVESNKNISDNIKHLEIIIDKAKNFFLSKTEVYNTFEKNIRPSLAKSIPQKDIEILKRNLTSFFGIKSLEKSMNTSFSNYNSLLYPSLQGETIVDKYNKLLSDEEFASNPLIKFMTTSKAIENNTPIDKLEVNSRVKIASKTFERFSNSFEDLYNNPKYKEFAKDLIRYLVVKDGLQFKSGSYIKFIIPEVFKTISDNLKIINKRFASNNTDISDIVGKSYEDSINEFSIKYLRDISNINRVRSFNKNDFKVNFNNKPISLYQTDTNFGSDYIKIYTDILDNNIHNSVTNVFNVSSSPTEDLIIDFPLVFKVRGGKSIYQRVSKLENLSEITGSLENESIKILGYTYKKVENFNTSFYASQLHNTIEEIENLDILNKSIISNKKIKQSTLSDSNLQIIKDSSSFGFQASKLEEQLFDEAISNLSEESSKDIKPSNSISNLKFTKEEIDEAEKVKNNRLNNPDC